MENLSLEDHAQSGPGSSRTPQPGPPGAMQPPPVPQLPPQMFTTAAQLLDLTDKKVMAWLRDGKKLFGVLRSWDQYGNLVLQDTTERIHAHTKMLYADIKRGIFIVRGENILLVGEIDLDKDEAAPEPWQEGAVEEVFELHRAEAGTKKRKEKEKSRKLQRIGFEGEQGGEISLV